MVYISISMGSSYRYIGVRVSIIRRDRGRSIIAISLSALFSVVVIGVLTTVDVGRSSGMVHVPVSVGGSYRYIGVRVSRVRIGRIDRSVTIRVHRGVGIVRTVSISFRLLIVGVGRVGMSDGVIGIVVRSVDRSMTMAVVVRSIHRSMATGDHGRAGRSAHMNFLVPRSLSGRQEAGQQKKREHDWGWSAERYSH